MKRHALALLAFGGLSGCADTRPGEVGPAPAAPSAAAEHHDVVYTTQPRPLVLDLYTPAGTPPFPLVVWIHGGAWVSGDENLFPLHPALLQRGRGYAVASIEYRLATEAVFPAQIHDCKAALRWLRANAETYGLDPRRVAVWGASAGGHLAALLGTSGGHAALEDPAQGHAQESSRVQAVVDWFGPTDYRLVTEEPGSPERVLLGCSSSECPDKAALASPVAHVDASDPPFLIQHGSADRVVALEHSIVLHEALLAAGVRSTLTVVEGAGHVDLRFVTPENLARIDAFLDAELAPGR